VDDVNDMNESPDIVEQVLRSSMKRRDFLTKAAAAGAIAWSAPVILSRPAYAADGGGGTPNCRPTITPACQLVSCAAGQKNFPGFTVSVPNCPCATPAKHPTTCIKITNVTTCGSKTVVAYGNGTDCSPNPATPDVILSTGNWVCFNSAMPVFFGPTRSGNGAIPDLSTCTFSFRVAVWAGNCPDRNNPTEAFDCQTFNVSVSYTSGSNATATCTFTAAPAAQSMCTTVPANSSPYGTCP
jgi:hypothetical protein